MLTNCQLILIDEKLYSTFSWGGFIVHLLLANWHNISCWVVLGHRMSCGVTGYIHHLKPF